MPEFTKPGKAIVEVVDPMPYVLKILDERTGREIIPVNINVLKHEIGPGPNGGRLTVIPFGHNRYGISSDPSRNYSFLLDKVILLENRVARGNRVLFMGRVQQVDLSVSENENSIALQVADVWQMMMDNPVVMETYQMLIGRALGHLDAGFKTEFFYNRVTKEWELRTKYFEFPLFPQLKGKQIGHIDNNLQKIFYMADNIRLEGQPTAQAIADLTAVKKNIVLDVDYKSDRTFSVVGRKIGDRKHRLVIGRMGKTIKNIRLIPDIYQMSGSFNYANIYNRIIGEGDFEKMQTDQVLAPTWNPDEEAEFVSNPNVRNSLRYLHVGRLYRLSEDTIPFDVLPSTRFLGLDDKSTWTDGYQLLELNPATNTWFASSHQGFPMVSRADAQVMRVPDEVFRRNHFRNGLGYFWMPNPGFGEYYTEEQQEKRRNGEDVEPTTYIKTFRFIAQARMDRFRYDTGVKGDYPIQRVKYYRNEQYQKVTQIKRLTMWDDRRIEEGEPDEPRDDSLVLSLECLDMLEESYRADVSIQIVLRTIEYKYNLGDMITEIVDVQGFRVLSDLDWVIRGISHDFDNWKTSLELSRNVKSMRGAAMLP